MILCTSADRRRKMPESQVLRTASMEIESSRAPSLCSEYKPCNRWFASSIKQLISFHAGSAVKRNTVCLFIPALGTVN